MGIISSILHTIVYVVSFWYAKLFGWWRSKAPKAQWMERLRTAQDFERWQDAALHLDNLFGFDLWREASASRYYDWALIKDRVKLLHETRLDPCLHHRLPNLIRSGLVRNLGNITSPKLYNCSFAGTKVLIEEYINQMICGIDDILSFPTSTYAGRNPGSGGRGWPPATALTSRSNADNIEEHGEQRPRQRLQVQLRSEPTTTQKKQSHLNLSSDDWSLVQPVMTLQHKMDFINDTRKAFGRTCLILQGGSIFGMCHLGIVKTLHERGLLPEVIMGTAVGALIAALVAVHTDEELPNVFSGDAINLSAFWKSKPQNGPSKPSIDGDCRGANDGGSVQTSQASDSYWGTLLRRLKRFWKTGYFLDMEVLAQCVRDNVGNLTFQEAFKRTGRVLNITVATSEQGGVPTVLNHITSPHVLIWTAASASNADFPRLYDHETQLLCKRPNGRIERWGPANAINFRHWTEAKYSDRNSPLKRVAELFNINNYIVSQARPYAVPFLQPDMHGPSFIGRGGLATSLSAFVVRITSMEVRQRLRQLDALHLLPVSIRRFLVDDHIPGGAASLTLVPEVRAADFARLLEVPSQESLRYWIMIGEKSVWPAMAALQIRCAIEMKLDWSFKNYRTWSIIRSSSGLPASEPPAVDAPFWQTAVATNVPTEQHKNVVSEGCGSPDPVSQAV